MLTQIKTFDRHRFDGYNNDLLPISKGQITLHNLLLHAIQPHIIKRINQSL